MATTHAQLPEAAVPPQPILVDRKQAAAMLAISESTIDRMRAEGGFPEPIMFGRAMRWQAEKLRAWAAAGCPSLANWKLIRSRKRRS